MMFVSRADASLSSSTIQGVNPFSSKHNAAKIAEALSAAWIWRPVVVEKFERESSRRYLTFWSVLHSLDGESWEY